MASRKGRKNNTWNTPVKLTMKTVAPLVDVKTFREIFPDAQYFFIHPLTDQAIKSRAGWDVPTKNNENPNTNEKMKPYVPAGLELIRRHKQGLPPKTNKELEEFCNGYKPVVVTKTSTRKTISESVRKQHIAAIDSMHGLCPCCLQVKIVENGIKIIGAGEFDHFYTNQNADLRHTWFICVSCHKKVTYNQVTRVDEFGDIFKVYQRRLANLLKDAAE